MAGYNYDVFDLAREEPAFSAFSSTLRAGSRAPSVELEDLETGASTVLSDLWAGGPVVVEFGSFS